MACAVLRKRSSTGIGDAPPLKRFRSSIPSTSSTSFVNYGDVLSFVSHLSRSASNVGTNMGTNMGTNLDTTVGTNSQAGTKRKREASPDQPAKRQCLRSASFRELKQHNMHLGVSADEAMDTSDVTNASIGVTAESKTSENVNIESIQSPQVSMNTGGEAEEPSSADLELEGATGGGATALSQQSESEVKFENDFDLICEIHPDIDPVYIREQLTLLRNDPQRISTVTFDLYENVEAPKREHREALEVVQQEYERLINMPFDLNLFLKRYPDPLDIFDVKAPEVTEIYYDYALVFLKNEFRSLQITYIRNTLEKTGFHLTPAYNLLKKDNERAVAFGGDKRKKLFKGKYLMYPRGETFEYPQGRDVIDDDFFWERLFVLNQEEILGHIAAEKEAKQLRLELARSEDRLRECTICASSEVLLEDMVPCPNEHLFCIDCVRHSTQELLGQGKASFPCLEPECGCHYPLVTLEKALNAETYSLVLRRVQGEEVRLAEIENIVCCPFCPYAVVMPDDISSSIFHCENPVCMEDSCRKCREVAHIPYSCEEFKAKREKNFEHFVENQMSEAMIRNCPKCHLRFFKEEGCNTMTCSQCNFKMCYVCRQNIKNYNHFRESPTCLQYTDVHQLHRIEITKAFNEADTKYREQHPELRNTNIVFAQSNLLETLILHVPS